jgi:hypothetical protein
MILIAHTMHTPCLQEIKPEVTIGMEKEEEVETDITKEMVRENLNKSLEYNKRRYRQRSNSSENGEGKNYRGGERSGNNNEGGREFRRNRYNDDEEKFGGGNGRGYDKRRY